MKITISKVAGGTNYQFEVDNDKEIEALAEAGFLAAMPTECKLCKSENIHLASNRAKGYLFVKMLCEDCNARAPVGQYKEGGFFWKAWEQYTPPAATGQSAPPPTEER